MKVSTKGRYGLRAMIDIAVHANGSHVPLIQVAARQDISENYLEQVIALLRKGGFVRSVKGAHGGYRLTRSPSEIGVGDLLRSLEGSISVVETVGDSDSGFDETLRMDVVQRAIRTQVWERIDRGVNEVVDAITLEDLVSEYRKLNGPDTLTYEI
jgi:Rrf2 family protein